MKISVPFRMRMDEIISNSLIIHEENTKEINIETEFGYVMKHLHKIKPTFISIFSLNTDLFEMLYQTLFLVFDILYEMFSGSFVFIIFKIAEEISSRVYG